MDEWAWTDGIRLVTRGAERADDRARTFERELPALGKLAFRVAYAVLRKREDAEEVAQEALLRAHQRLRGLRDADRLRAWLVRIAWRRALDRRRSDRRRDRLESHPLPVNPAPSPEHEAAREEMRRHLWRAIDELPERQRRVLVLASIEEHDLSSVARLMDLPVGTVKSRLHAARGALLEKLRWIANESENC